MDAGWWWSLYSPVTRSCRCYCWWPRCCHCCVIPCHLLNDVRLRTRMWTHPGKAHTLLVVEVDLVSPDVDSIPVDNISRGGVIPPADLAALTKPALVGVLNHHFRLVDSITSSGAPVEIEDRPSAWQTPSLLPVIDFNVFCVFRQHHHCLWSRKHRDYHDAADDVVETRVSYIQYESLVSARLLAATAWILMNSLFACHLDWEVGEEGSSWCRCSTTPKKTDNTICQ